MNLRPEAEPKELVPPTPPSDSQEIAASWRGAVPCPVKAGEVHFHHALMWHGSLPNRGVRPRRAYSIFYMPDGTRVSSAFDPRVALEPGTFMTEAGPGFPIVYPLES
jgi:ectoine hydroxylase-related dioxygenase (phytanoyl-CoA dioxygenase family)